MLCVFYIFSVFINFNFLQVFYYSVSIFRKAGLSLENSQFATIAAGCCNLLMAVISIPVMARVNRRITLQLSLLSTAIFLIILGLAITLIVREATR